MSFTRPFAKILAAFLLAGAALAAGRFDGVWTGGAPSAGPNCPPADFRVMVTGSQVTIEGVMHRASGADMLAGAGVVEDDGSFSGTLSGAPIKGKFDASSFSGTYHSDLCQSDRRVDLERAK